MAIQHDFEVPVLNYASPKAGRKWGGLAIRLSAATVLLLLIWPILFRPTFSSHDPSEARRAITRNMIDPAGPLAASLESYRRKTGSYPVTLDALTARPKVPGQPDQRQQPYIEDPEKLKDPWGNKLRYRVPSIFNAKGYDLWSTGPDGLDGTPDDIGNW